MTSEESLTQQTPYDLPSAGSIVVRNVHIPYADKERAAQRWTVECSGGRIAKITPSDATSSTVSPMHFEPPTASLIDGTNSLLVPSCGDLIKGDFTEAMKVTKLAKTAFASDSDDLYSRGARVIRESVRYGVTSMRAHVEVDSSVGFACLEVGQRLQEDYRAQCDVQLAIFAQEPLFMSADDENPGENFVLLKQAASQHGLSVVGSAPYVEPTVEKAKKNISLIFDIADAHNLDLVDFHLDYNLDPNAEPLVYEVIAQAKRRYRIGRAADAYTQQSASSSPLPVGGGKKLCPRITIGHATRLQLFSAAEWRALADSIAGMPITFVSLPQSDIYMQGRGHSAEPLGAPRGTLRVPHLAREYGVDVAMAVNNVANAFTPQGSLDPLSLCTFGVGIFQAATPEDVRTLVRSISLTSKWAIGLPHKQGPADVAPSVGDQADFVILHGESTLQGVVLSPPFDRTTVKAGQLVAYKRGTKWLSE